MSEGTENNNLIDFGLTEDKSKGIIKVIGVGGGGCNAVNNMYDEGIVGVTFAACNTDSKQLSHVSVPVKVLMGKSGLGAGGNPEKGKEEAEYSQEAIQKLLSDGTQMAFVTAGMGGGTGTGAAPLVAKTARDMGILTVGVVTLPFYFEKKRKIKKALLGVMEMKRNVDALLIVNNERLCDIYCDSDVYVKEAFKRADNILRDAVKSISELITVYSDGGIDIDFRDVEATTKNGGGSIMAMGRANGDKRVEKAITDALDSPLMYGNDIHKAKKILFNIYASDKAPIFVREMQEIDEFFDQLDPNIEVIWGIATDNTLEDDVKVTILATGMEDALNEQRYNGDNAGKGDVIDEYLGSVISLLYKPMKKEIPSIPEDNKNAADGEDEEPQLIIEGGVPDEPAVVEEEEKQPKENPLLRRMRTWIMNSRITKTLLAEE